MWSSPALGNRAYSAKPIMVQVRPVAGFGSLTYRKEGEKKGHTSVILLLVENFERCPIDFQSNDK